MKNFVILAAVAACFTFAVATQVNKCSSGLPTPVRVDVMNCEKAPCELPKGTSIYINITFDAPNDLEIFEPKIKAHALGMDVDYPLKEQDGCKELLKGSCPLEEGVRVVYGTSIDILSFYPNIDFGIEFTLLTYNDDEEKFAFTCFQIDGKVTNK